MFSNNQVLNNALGLGYVDMKEFSMLLSYPITYFLTFWTAWSICDFIKPDVEAVEHISTSVPWEPLLVVKSREAEIS